MRETSVRGITTHRADVIEDGAPAKALTCTNDQVQHHVFNGTDQDVVPGKDLGAFSEINENMSGDCDVICA